VEFPQQVPQEPLQLPGQEQLQQQEREYRQQRPLLHLFFSQQLSLQELFSQQLSLRALAQRLLHRLLF